VPADGAVNDPLNAPPLTVFTVAAVVQGPDVDVLYWRRTGEPLGTAEPLLATVPEKGTPLCPADRGVVIELRVGVVVNTLPVPELTTTVC
jgi:hypothetical protein